MLLVMTCHRYAEQLKSYVPPKPEPVPLLKQVRVTGAAPPLFV